MARNDLPASHLAPPKGGPRGGWNTEGAQRAELKGAEKCIQVQGKKRVNDEKEEQDGRAGREGAGRGARAAARLNDARKLGKMISA